MFASSASVDPDGQIKQRYVTYMNDCLLAESLYFISLVGQKAKPFNYVNIISRRDVSICY